MKFFLLLVVILFGVWLFRSSRQASVSQEKTKAQPKSTPPEQPQEMVSCQLCAIHFPQSDAVPGRLGLYCCSEHYQRAEP